MTGVPVGRRAHRPKKYGPELSFGLDLKIEQPVEQISDISGNLTIISDGIKSTNRIPYYGITFSNEKFFVLFGTFSKEDEMDFEWARNFFRNHSRQASTGLHFSNQTLYFNHQIQIHRFLKDYPNRHIAFRIVTLSFTIFNQNKTQNSTSNPFHLSTFSKGTFYEGDVKMHINGVEYDSSRYSIETRLYLILLSFLFVLLFHSWKSLNDYSNTQSHVSSISIVSLLSIFAFDLSVCFNFNIIATVNDCFMPPQQLTFFLFISHVILFLAFQFPILYRIFKQQHNSFIYNFFTLFLFILIFSLSYTFQFSSTKQIIPINLNYKSKPLHSFTRRFAMKSQTNSFDEKKLLLKRTVLPQLPKLVIIFICLSQFVPQIIKNMIKSQKRGMNLTFIVWIGISRICLYLYHDIYKYNIYEIEPKDNYYSLSSLLILIQVFILIFQNYFGSFFFLPKLVKPKLFNYQATKPPEGEMCSICREIIDVNQNDTAVTPCGHAFHLSCLSLWMEEQQICPICRTDIPQIQNAIKSPQLNDHQSTGNVIHNEENTEYRFNY